MALLEMLQQESDKEVWSFFPPSEVVLKCLSVIFTQFPRHLFNTYYVLCLVLGGGNLQQSTQESPVFMELNILEKKDSKQMSRYVVWRVVLKLTKEMMNAVKKGLFFSGH